MTEHTSGVAADQQDQKDPAFAGPCARCGGGVPSDQHRGEFAGVMSRFDNETYICTACGRDEAVLLAKNPGKSLLYLYVPLSRRAEKRRARDKPKVRSVPWSAEAKAILWAVRSAKDNEVVMVPTIVGDCEMVRLTRRKWEDVETGIEFEHRVIVNAAWNELEKREVAREHARLADSSGGGSTQ